MSQSNDVLFDWPDMRFFKKDCQPLQSLSRKEKISLKYDTAILWNLNKVLFQYTSEEKEKEEEENEYEEYDDDDEKEEA